MRQRVAVLLAASALAGCAAPAHSVSLSLLLNKVGNSGGNPNVQLADVSVPFGALTNINFGRARLGAVTAPSTGTLGNLPLGNLNLVTGGTPVSWTETCTSAPAGHTCATDFNVLSGSVAEGALAVTPTPKVAPGNLATSGNYVFTLTATDANGFTSTHTLTYAMVALASNIGNTDPQLRGDGAANFPAGMDATGAKFMFSVGANLLGVQYPFLDLNKTHNIEIDNADDSRRALISGIYLHGASNFTINNITIDERGRKTHIAPAVFQFSSYPTTGYASTNNTLNNPTAYFDPLDPAQTTTNLVLASGVTGLTVNNAYADTFADVFVEGSYGNNSNITFNGAIGRRCTANLIFIGSLVNGTFNDLVNIGPIPFGNVHPDTFQIAAGATPQNIQVNRIENLTADGNSAQGAPYAGAPYQYTGYISGTTLTITGPSSGVFTPYLGSLLGPYGGVTAGTHVLSQQTIGAHAWLGNYTVDTSQNVGSVGSPVTIALAPMGVSINGELDGGQPNGAYIDSLGGTLQNITFLPDNIGPIITTGTLVGGSGGVDGYYDGVPISGGSGTYATGRVHVSGGSVVALATCVPIDNITATCSPNGPVYAESGGNNFLTSDTLSMASASIGGVTGLTFKPATVGLPYNPVFKFSWADQGVNSYSVGAALKSAYTYGSIVFLTKAQTTGTQPPNLTIGTGVSAGAGIGTGVIQNAQAAAANDFNVVSTVPTILAGVVNQATWTAWLTAAGGPGLGLVDPGVFLQQVPAATWAAMSIPQVRAVYGAAATPNCSGTSRLWAGGTSAYGALNCSGLWNDGSGKGP